MDANTIIETYELGSFYSGGGCQHYAKTLASTETPWLINRSLPELGNDPDFDLPYSDFKGAFMFSLDTSEFNEADNAMAIGDALFEHFDFDVVKLGVVGMDLIPSDYIQFSTPTFLEGITIILAINKTIEDNINKGV